METLTYNVIIPTLVFFSVFAIGASLILANRQKKAMLGIKLQDSRLVELPQKQKAKADILRFLAKIGNFVSHGNTSKTLSEQLLRAGYIKSTASCQEKTHFCKSLYVFSLKIRTDMQILRPKLLVFAGS